MFSLICAWINGWVNNGEASNLRRHHAHYDVTVILFRPQCINTTKKSWDIRYLNEQIRILREWRLPLLMGSNNYFKSDGNYVPLLTIKPFVTKYGLKLIPAWIRNHIHHTVCGEITSQNSTVQTFSATTDTMTHPMTPLPSPPPRLLPPPPYTPSSSSSSSYYYYYYYAPMCY